MRIIGIDPSLTATAIATDSQVSTIRTRQKGTERLILIRDQVLELVGDADLIVLEGYGFASTRIAYQAELGGVLRVAFREAGLMVVTVAPSALKRYATGRGNAKKEEVFAAAIRRLAYEGVSHDEADALWLRAMGCDAYGLTEPGWLPKQQREVLSRIIWPESQAQRVLREAEEALK